MRYIPRTLAGPLLKAAPHFPVLILTGPRRSGKTTLFRRIFPKASYHLLEDPDIIGRARSDPRSFLDEIRLPAILDEIQNVPELLGYIRSRVDATGSRQVRWLLTGSQEPALMKGVTESMAGRAAIFRLFPLSQAETSKVTLLKGGFPEVLSRPEVSEIWFRSYIQTYLERDVRSISSIRDLATFRRFLALTASRVGRILNRSDLAAPLGVSVPTITGWLNILEATQQIILVPPYFENFGKRLIKSPKLYFADTGLAAHLLGIENERGLTRSPFTGPLFESFVASEIVKSQINAGARQEIYYFRDSLGLEVDFLIPRSARRLLLLEAKASRTPRPEDAESIDKLKRSIRGYAVEAAVLHQSGGSAPSLTSVREGVRSATVADIPDLLE